MVRCVLFALVAAGCGRLGFDPLGGGLDGGGLDRRGGDARTGVDGGVDGPGAAGASDDFDRADSDSPGSKWLVIGGTLDRPPGISANRATCCPTVAGDESTAVWEDMFAPDQFSQITTLGVADRQLGAVVRGSTTEATLYFCGKDANDFSGPDLRIVRFIQLVAVELASSPTPLAAGDVVRLEIVGDALTCSVNGNPVLTATDATITSGRTGFFVLSAAADGAAVDDWSGGEL
jgi:hypothetical protein